MNKRFCITLLLCLLPACLFAQVTVSDDGKTKTITEETEIPDGKIITTTTLEKENVFTNGLWYNWELMAGVGPHVYMGENDTKVRNKLEMLSFPAIDLYLTKWVSPSFGFALGLTGAQFKGLYQANDKTYGENAVGANFQTGTPYTTADPKWDYMQLAVQKGWYADIYGVFMVDILNTLAGYNPDRYYSLIGYAGGGFLVGGDNRGLVPSAAANLGLINSFRINNDLRFFINVRGAFVADDFDGEMYIQEPSMAHWKSNVKMDGDIGVTVGLTIALGKGRNTWRPASRTSEIVYNEVVKEKEAEYTEIVPEVEYQVDTVHVSTIPDVWFHINFDINRWEILNRELVNLQAVADLIKSTPDIKYLVCGYADMQTATPKHNLMLSDKRSQAVVDMLVNTFGVDPDQLVRDYKGGVDYMFYEEKELSRCVMITAIGYRDE